MTTAAVEREAPEGADAEACAPWVAVARDVVDGVVSPWSVAADLGALGDEELVGLPQGEAVAVVELCRRLSAVVEAVQVGAIEAVARRDEEQVEALEERWLADRRERGLPCDAATVTPLRGWVSARESTLATVLPVLQLSPRAVEVVVEDARMLVGSLPETFALARAGRLSGHHARVVAGAAQLIAVDKRGEFDLVAVHPELGRRRYRRRLPELATPALRQRVAQVAADVDPDSLHRHAQAAREGRHVRVRAGLEPGVSSWSASLTTEDSLAMWAAIDALADELLRADETAEASLLRDDERSGADTRCLSSEALEGVTGDGSAVRRRGIAAARADALVALVLGRATVTTTVDLSLPLTDWPTAPRSAEDVGGSTEDGPVDEDGAVAEPVAELIAEPAAGQVAEPAAGQVAESGGPVAEPGAVTEHDRVTGDMAARVRALLRDTLLLDTQEDAVHGVPVVRARAHLRLVGDRPTSPGTEPDQTDHRDHRDHGGGEDPAPPTPAERRPSPPISPLIPPLLPTLLPRVIGVEHPRVGVLLPDAVVRLLADPDTRVRLHGCHPDTGALTTHDPTTYRPGAALARAVRARDGHCRFPGCTTAAARCQLDHVTPYPAGPTTAENLAALCVGHHRLKTHTPWRYALHDDGTCTWTSPLGHTYDTHPDRPTDRAA